MKNFFLQKILLLLVLLTFSRCEIDSGQGYTFVYSRPASEPWAELVGGRIFTYQGTTYIISSDASKISDTDDNIYTLIENDVDSATYCTRDSQGNDPIEIRFSNVTSNSGVFFVIMYNTNGVIEEVIFYSKGVFLFI